MRQLNYHHLLYFWVTARAGTLAKASAELGLSQPTISAQIRQLESVFDVALFERRGRGLALTETGSAVLAYADDIFALGRELTSVLAGHAPARPLHVRIGVANVVPKLVAHRLLEPALGAGEGVRLLVREDDSAHLCASLATHDLDVVLSDATLPPTVGVKAFHHLLLECGVTICAVPALARRLRRGFPHSLATVPFLLPTAATALRRSLDQWVAAQGLVLNVVGEFDDSALVKVFGQKGAGAFAIPSVIEADVKRQHEVQVVGRLDGVKERFYAISLERRVTHPAVAAICAAARE